MKDKNDFKILLIEDNPGHVELIKRHLMRINCVKKIHNIEDGESALNFLMQGDQTKTNPEAFWPNIILLDLRLPKIDGLTILKEIKNQSNLCSIPIIVLTSSSSEDDIKKAYQNHANSYLVKPIDFDDFDKLITHLSDYWIQWNQYKDEPEVT